MTPIQLQMMSLTRKSFSGLTDKYAVGRPAPAGNLVESVRRELGFIDVSKGAFGEFYRETASERLRKYKKALDFYEGKQWMVPVENGESKPVNNFCNTVVDTTADFTYGTGVTFQAIPGNELVAEAVSEIWKFNGTNKLYRNIVDTGSLLGDVFLYASHTAEGKIRILSLNPMFCFPLFERDSNTIKAIIIQYPGDAPSESGAPVMNSIYITPEYFKEFTDENETKVTPNPWGLVPVVHIPNDPIPGKLFGRSDLESVIPLNEEYNTMMYKMRRIISYHAEPTTVVFGAKASKLEKGANKVWSGLPADARVENLTLNSDLSAIQMYMDRIEKAICRVGKLPRVALDMDIAVSNTSGIAIRMMYKPLQDKVAKKCPFLAEGMERLNAIILLLMERTGVAVKTLADHPERLAVSPVFTSSLPTNETELLDVYQKQLNMGVTSRAEVFRNINVTKDMTRIASEIVMDARAELALQKEKAVALQGAVPDGMCAFLGSIPAGEDLQETAKELSAKEPKQEQEEEDDDTTEDTYDEAT